MDKKAIEKHTQDNIERVKNLVKLYGKIKTPGSGRAGTLTTDILRSAVVLLHASVEDFLRSLARWRLPELGDKEALDDIPLLIDQSKKPHKITLGELVDYRNLRVNDVIKGSVKKYLERSNYSDTKQISSLLESIDIEVEKVNGTFNMLSNMILRRHKIVHEADKNKVPGSGNHETESIKKNEVNSWINAVEIFVAQVLGEIG